jgi:hypothetical protein
LSQHSKQKSPWKIFASKQAQSREISHTNRTERYLTLGSILEFLEQKVTGASSQHKELLPLQAQKGKITFNPMALNDISKGKTSYTPVHCSNHYATEPFLKWVLKLYTYLLCLSNFFWLFAAKCANQLWL